MYSENYPTAWLGHFPEGQPPGWAHHKPIAFLNHRYDLRNSKRCRDLVSLVIISPVVLRGSPCSFRVHVAWVRAQMSCEMLTIFVMSYCDTSHLAGCIFSLHRSSWTIPLRRLINARPPSTLAQVQHRRDTPLPLSSREHQLTPQRRTRCSVPKLT